MKIKILIVILAVAVIAAVCCVVFLNKGNEDGPDTPSGPDKTVTETEVVLYDGPEIMMSSSVVGVKVESEPLFVYDTRVNHARSFTFTESKDYNQVVIFDFEGSVDVEVEVYGASALYDVVVRPLSRQVEPQVSGNKITFTLDYTDNYVVEYALEEGGTASDNALHIFANPIEEDPVREDDVPENTVYVGPGVWMASALPVSENDTTVYLAGGAVVYGQIRAANLSNLTIRGRGILAGELFSRTKDSEFTLPIELQNCTDVTIKDIAILDPAGWAVTLYQCSNVTVDNLKIITARANGDGISVQSSDNVTVTGGFIRTWDDTLVVKNVDNTSTSDILFDGVYVWTDLAQSMEVGYETYGATMTDITFRNITVLHNFHKAAMSIHNADNAEISNVTYENITIEDARMLGDNQLDGENDFLIDITIAYNAEWTHSGGERGSVRDIVFNNIKVIEMADSIMCRVYGEGSSSNVDGVSISNIEIEGKLMKSLADIKLTPGVYTSNITYSSSGNEVTGADVVLPYKLELSQDDAPEITKVSNVLQAGLVVPDFAVLNNDPSYAGKKVDTSSVVLTATYGSGDRATADWNLGNIPEKQGKSYKNLLDGDRASEWIFSDWQGLDNEFVALSFDFGSATQIGNIRILGTSGSNIMRYYSVSIFAKTEADGDWKRIQAQSDIALSPQASNYADVLIRLNANGYYGLQLRFFYGNDITHPEEINVGEIEFYPPSLTTSKSFVEVAEHEDVYDITNMIDGNVLTYFESKKGVFPAVFAIDMAQEERVKYINIHLPPLLLWEPRSQEIEILGSADGVTYFTVVEKTTYLFDPADGNMAAIVLDEAVAMRYIKLVYTSNTSGYGAQISELYVYGE